MTVEVCGLLLKRHGGMVPSHSRTKARDISIPRMRLLFRHAPWASSPGMSEPGRTALASGFGMP